MFLPIWRGSLTALTRNSCSPRWNSSALPFAKHEYNLQEIHITCQDQSGFEKLHSIILLHSLLTCFLKTPCCLHLKDEVQLSSAILHDNSTIKIISLFLTGFVYSHWLFQEFQPKALKYKFIHSLKLSFYIQYNINSRSNVSMPQ